MFFNQNCQMFPENIWQSKMSIFLSYLEDLLLVIQDQIIRPTQVLVQEYP